MCSYDDISKSLHKCTRKLTIIFVPKLRKRDFFASTIVRGRSNPVVVRISQSTYVRETLSIDELLVDV